MEKISSNQFHASYMNRDREVAKWKQGIGGRVCGCINPYTPEEIIHAAGNLPLGIVGGVDNTRLADAYMADYSCSFTQNLLEKMLRGDYDYLDSVVLTAFCDSMLGLYNTIERVLMRFNLYLMHYPSELSNLTHNYFSDELQRLKAYIGTLSQKEISDESLRRSIRIYNENRNLLKRLYELRKQDSPPINGVEMLEIVLSSMVIPKERHNQMLQGFLRSIPEQEKRSSNRSRILVSGHVVDQPDLLKAIEETGALVVADDLDTGTRYFWHLVDETREPLEALAKRYLEIPSPFREPFDDRISHLMSMAKEFGVDGIIFLTRKFCDPYLFDRPYLDKALQDEGYPTLSLEQEYPMAKMAFKKRVEAFVEMLK